MATAKLAIAPTAGCGKMTQVEHHYQRVDLEGGGFVEATRDDTDEIQDLHYAVWKDGKQILADG